MIEKQCQFSGEDRGGIYVHLLHPGYDDSIEFVKEAQASLPVIDELKAFLKEMRKPTGKVHALVSALGAGEFWGSNTNGDFFPEHSLIHTPKNWKDLPIELQRQFGAKWEWGYPTFYNAHAFQHHVNKDPNRAFGNVIHAAWDDPMKRVLLVVEVDRGKAAEMGASGVVDKIENGSFPDVSMGCRVPFDLCSICTDWGRISGNPKKDLAEHRRKPIRGLSVTTKDYCQHLQFENGKIYPDGRKVWMWNLHPRFFDISFVFIGADKSSKVLAKLASGKCPVRVDSPICPRGCTQCSPDGLIKSAHVHDVWDRDAAKLEKQARSVGAPISEADRRKQTDDTIREFMKDPEMRRRFEESMTKKSEIGAFPEYEDDDDYDPRTERSLNSYFEKKRKQASVLLKGTLPGAAGGALIGGAVGSNRSDEGQKLRGAAKGALFGGLIGGATGTAVSKIAPAFHQSILNERRLKMDLANTHLNIADRLRQNSDMLRQLNNPSKPGTKINKDAIQAIEDSTARIKAQHGGTEELHARIGKDLRHEADNIVSRYEQEVGDTMTQLAIPAASLGAAAGGVATTKAFKKKEASDDLGVLAEAFGIDKTAGLSFEKQAEIIKRIQSHFNRALPDVEAKEPDLPDDILDDMSECPRKALGTAGGLGIVLKPREFQRVYLKGHGMGHLAEDLGERGMCFRPGSAEPDPLFRLSHDIIPKLLSVLKPLIAERSALGPPLKRRVLKITIIGKPRPEAVTPDHPVMDKIASAYQAYRQQLVYGATDLIDKAFHADPSVLEHVAGDLFQNSGPGIVKSAGDVVQSVLGMFPSTYLNRVYLPGPVSGYVEDHANYAGMREAGALAASGGVV